MKVDRERTEAMKKLVEALRLLLSRLETLVLSRSNQAN